MIPLISMRSGQLATCLDDARAEYETFAARSLKIDMTRGKPSPEQLDLCNAMLSLPGNGDYFTAEGGDGRNYFGSIQGLPEARSLFSAMMGAPPERIAIGNNASLAMMHDCIVYALLKGVPGGQGPWKTDEPIAFLCPSPGYDRHFALCEEYGIRMIPVAMTGHGPDMDAVERLVLDPQVRGMWCVPKYSNPTGESYSADTAARLAAMPTGAADFRLFWDNAYGVHHLTDQQVEIANILDLCEKSGNPDRALVFASTSKITFAGGGLSMMAASEANIAWYGASASKRTIGPDKLNQLRHVRFLRDKAGINRLMAGHQSLLRPTFDAVEAAFEKRLGGSGIAEWTRPLGGYFVSVDVLPGCARRVVELAGELGIAMVAGGQTFPYRTDPQDTNLRIAPSYPSVGDVAIAAAGIAVCILVAAAENLVAKSTT